MPKTTTAPPKHSTELTPLELHAVAAAAKAAAKVRDHLSEGPAQAVDVTVRIKGLLTIGLAESRPRAVKPELATVLALALEILPSGERRKLEKRLDTLFANFAGGEEWPGADANMRILAETAIDRWTKREEREQRGSVTGIVSAEVLMRGG